MPVLSNLIVRIGASTDDFDKQVDRSLNKVKRFASDVSAAGQALAIGFSAPLVAAGGFALQAAARMETLNMGLNAVMKDARATATEMEKLKEVAKLPGLGLAEAVQGSIKLQILGNSAERSRKIMLEFGNALAIVGGGRDDFNEVIRQLGQMAAAGKVTSDNLKPMTERIPQLAAIIKEKFGEEALGKPAETMKKLGINSREFIDILVAELSKGARAGDTFKNALENLQEKIQQTAAAFGKALLPMAQRVLDEFLTPMLGKVADLGQAFAELPQPIQNVSVGLAAVAAAAPLVIVAVGTLIEKFSAISQVLNKMPWGAVGAGIGVVILAFENWNQAMQVADKLKDTSYQLGVLTGIVLDANKYLEKLMITVKSVSDNFPDLTTRLMQVVQAMQEVGKAAYMPGWVAVKSALELINVAMAAATGRTKEMDDAIQGLNRRNIEQGAQNIKLAADMKNFGGAVAEAAGEVRKSGDAHAEVAEKVTNHVEKLKQLHKVTFESELLARSMAEAMQKHASQVDKATDIVRSYGTVSLATALNLAKMADEQFRLNRALEDAPAISMGIDFSKIPKAPKPNLPGPGGFEEYKKASKNIGELGMQTKEQYEAMKRAASGSSKVQAAALKQVSTVLTDLSRGITDVIFKGGKMGDMFKNVALQAAQSITRLLIEGALTSLGKKILDVGGTFGKVFGGGGGVVKSVTDSGGDLGAAATSGIGSATSGAASGVAGIVGAVGSVVSAISGVIGNFQMAHMNTALGRIEESTRYLKIWTGEQSQSLLWCAQKSTEYLGYMVKSLDMIGVLTSQMLGTIQQSGGAGTVTNAPVSVVINLNGGNQNAALEEITRLMKQYGIVPRYA